MVCVRTFGSMIGSGTYPAGSPSSSSSSDSKNMRIIFAMLTEAKKQEYKNMNRLKIKR